MIPVCVLSNLIIQIVASSALCRELEDILLASGVDSLTVLACERASCQLARSYRRRRKTTFLLSRVSAETAQMVFDVPCGTHCRLRFLGCIARELRFLFFSPLLMLMLFFFCLSVDMRWIHGLRIAASIAEQPELESVRSCNVYDN